MIVEAQLNQDYRELALRCWNQSEKQNFLHSPQELEPEASCASIRSPGLLVFVLSLSLCSISFETLAQIDNHIQFVEDFRELQDLENESARRLYAFVRRSLRAYHLDGSYSEAHVLNEALLRGVQRIHYGKLIRNSSAWLRSTCWNIVRELSREQAKTVPLEASTDVEEIEQPTPLSEEIEDDLTTAGLAYQLLDKMDQRLLNLKIVEDRAWGEIRAIFRQEGYGDCQESSLRKRKERALNKLRKKYHSLKLNEP